MNTKIRFLACALALASSWAGLKAEEPNNKGHVLILDSERTLEGDIERVGDHYNVQRVSGGKTTVPGEKVIYLASDMIDAYRYLRGQANLNDPDERLRLAQWCHFRGLKEQALEEVKAAVELRPKHEPSQRLLDYLAKATESKPVELTKKPVPEPAETPSNVDVTAEAMTLFSSRVQPILMNACAQCHAGDRAGAFRIRRSFEPANLGEKTLRENLTAVLGQINLEQPNASPFLTKAVSVHGAMAQPPLNKRQRAAYKTLEDWVNLTISSNPQLRPAHLETAVTPPPAKENFAVSSTKANKPESERSSPARPGVTPITEKAGANSSEKSEPAPQADPFDPNVFNKQAHPEAANPDKDKR
jgi:hypothetical protein